MKAPFLVLWSLLIYRIVEAAENNAALESLVHFDTPRSLQEGNFQRFNALIEDLRFPVNGAFDFREDLGIATVSFGLDEIECFDVSVGDMIVEHTVDSTQSIGVTINILSVDLKCEFDYGYRLGFFRGGGGGRITAADNSLSMLLGFSSPDFSTQPPSGSDMLGCTAAMDVTELDFFGDILGEIVEELGQPIRDLLAGELENVVCDQLGSLGTSFVDNFLDVFDDLYSEFSGDVDPTLEDPLYLENNKNLSDSVVLLGSLDSNDVIVDFVNRTLQDFESTLIGNDASEGEEGQGLGINGFIRDQLLNGDGELSFGASELGMDSVLFVGDQDLTKTKVVLDQMKIFGLDTLTKFEPQDRVGNSTLQTNMVWERLGMEFLIQLEIEGKGEGESTSADRIAENLSLAIEMENVDVLVSFFVAIDQEVFGDIKMGQLLEIDNILPCFMPILHSSEIAGLSIGSDVSLKPNITGFESPGMEEVLGNSALAVFDLYKGAFSTVVPKIFQTDVRNALNRVLVDTLENMEDSCPIIAPATNNDVDFRDLLLPAEESIALGGTGQEQYGDAFPTLMGFLKDEFLEIDPSTGLSKINSALIAPLTKSQSNEPGVLDFPGDLFGGGTRINVGGLDANVELRIRDLRIDNLDSIGAPLDLLVPVANSGQELNNTLSIGLGDRSLGAGLNVLLAIAEGDGTQLKNDINIQLDLSQATVVLGVMLKIAETRLNQFPVRDIFDLNCWMAMISTPELDEQGIRVQGVDPTAALTELATSIAALNLNFTCNECSGPQMEELTELLSFSGKSDNITEGSDAVLGLLGDFLDDDFLQIRIDRALADAVRKCPHRSEYDPNFSSARYQPFSATNPDSSTTFLVLLGGVVLGLVFAVSLLMIVIKYIVRRRHSRWLSTMSNKEVLRILKRQDALRQQEALLDDGTHAMVSSPAIPVWIRYSMPVIILGNIAFFLSGHLSLGATVNIVLEFAGEKIVVENFYEFSMARSTVDIWNAGGRELAILILIFSGIWPYTKQIITLVLWFLPPSRVSVSRRGSILLWLDWLAKWSMIDIFVLVVSLVAFRVSIQSPDVGFLPENFYSVDLLVVPVWGLYANMTAQLISQISSHFIIHYHRRIITAWREGQEDSSECDGKESQEYLMEHRFSRPHRGEDERLVARKSINSLLTFAATFALALFVTGCCLRSVSFNILGVIGVLVEIGQGVEANLNYSILSIFGALLDQARFLGTAGDWVGLITLSLIVLVTVLIVPICQILALLLQWFHRTSTKQKARAAILIEILQAWQYAEVYLISIVFASWQVGPISEFMINAYCDSLNPTLAQLAFFGIIKEEDAQCFLVESTVEPGFYLLLVGAIVLALVNTFVNKAVVQYFRDQSEANFKGDMIDLEVAAEKEKLGVDKEQVHRAPVLFSDTFRWALKRDDADQLSDASESSASRKQLIRPNGGTGLTQSRSEDGSRDAEGQEDASEATSHVSSYERKYQR